MYSERVTKRVIESYLAKLDFEPRYHSVSEVEVANSHLNGLFDFEVNKLKRQLEPPEKEWIDNERFLSKHDFRYYISRYCWIRDWRNQLIRFTPNIAQNIAIDIFGDLEEQGRAIALQQLKGRQLGVSTLDEHAVKHRAQFYSNVNAVVGSSDPDKSRKMAKIMELCWGNQPWWLMPVMTKYVSGEVIEFGRQNSAVSIQHGTQFSGIARGDTPSCVHLSELPDYDDPRSLIDAGLLMAMHESPEMFLALESTAAGIHNWWHNTWLYNKQNYHLGRSRLCPMFLPYFVGRDIYPTDTWLRSRPIPEAWEPEGLTIHHAERAKAYVKSDRLLRKHLGEDWELPREQMWFWEVTRQEYKDKGELAIFYQELCSDDHEAFQSSNQGVFDTDTVSAYREATREPLAVFGFVGPTIPERIQPSRREIDPNRPPLPIVRTLPSGMKYECTLYPLKFTGYPTTDFTNKLFVWETPQENSLYGVGVDTGDGVGLDRTTIEVLRKGDYERNDLQVAEFASAYINAFDLSPIVYAVSSLYSTRIRNEVKQAKLVIECNRNGESTQLELRKMGWSNFHHWMRYDNKRLRQSSSHKLGWYTNVWSRSMMMDFLIKMLRDGWVDVNSPWFVDEMSDLERNESLQSARASFGGHDDRIMALGIVLFSLHVMELRGTQRGAIYSRQDKLARGYELPMYHGGAQTLDVMEGA